MIVIQWFGFDFGFGFVWLWLWLWLWFGFSLALVWLCSFVLVLVWFGLVWVWFGFGLAWMSEGHEPAVAKAFAKLSKRASVYAFDQSVKVGRHSSW